MFKEQASELVRELYQLTSKIQILAQTECRKEEGDQELALLISEKIRPIDRSARQMAIAIDELIEYRWVHQMYEK